MVTGTRSAPPAVVVTHHPPGDTGRWTTISFADSLESGIAAARQIAGDKDVSIPSASIAAQALDLGLDDVGAISLVLQLMGKRTAMDRADKQTALGGNWWNSKSKIVDEVRFFAERATGIEPA